MRQPHYRRPAAKAGAPIVLVDGDKGGVGKSFMARALAGQLLTRRYPVHCFDGDYRNGLLERHYGKHCPVERLDLRTEEGFSDFYDTLDWIDDDAIVICDLPAGVGGRLQSEAERLHFNRDFGREIIHVWMADTGEDSVRQFKELQFLANPAHSAFVMNLRGKTDPKRFAIWHESNLRTWFLAGGGLELRLPHMADGLHDRIARAQAPFLLDPAPEGLTRSDLLSLRIFDQHVATEFSPLIDLILRG